MERDNVADEIGWRLIKAETESRGDRGSVGKPEGSSQTQAGKGALGFGGLCHFPASVYLFAEFHAIEKDYSYGSFVFEFIKTVTFAI